jgi:DNA-binding transcriptional LysR family regulator
MKYLDIDLKLLELFCCVYEKGSISESSDCLHLSQSTISFHMHQLENQIGLKLFLQEGQKAHSHQHSPNALPIRQKGS